MTRIKELRISNGDTQKELASMLGITRGAYANIEDGRREPDIETMTILANHFQVTIDYLVGFDAKKEPTPVSEGGPDRNTIRMAGRDGSFIERRLTDEQLEVLKLMLKQLPEADDL